MDKSADAPREVIDFAKSLFRTRRHLVLPQTSPTRKILATLKLDVSPLSPIFGERSVGTDAERQMLFEAGEYDLDLRIRAFAGGFNLAGQILGELSNQNLIALEDSQFNALTNVNQTGEFKIQNVPPGSYELTLRIGATEIVIEALTLG